MKMKQLKNILIATTLLCSAAHACNQSAWNEMATNPLLEGPRALHSLITWMDPVMVVLPRSSLHARTQLVIDLVDYYNEHLKPNVDRRLINLFADYLRDCSLDMHKYITDSLERFVSRFANNNSGFTQGLYKNSSADLVPANLYIDSRGYYEFENCE